MNGKVERLVICLRNEEGMKHLDLFSGIGGFALAAKVVGIETVAFCEIEEFPCNVLEKNFPGVPIHPDIRELNGEDYEGIDLITGGYPCQPFSVAGSQRAEKDDRHLWPEMCRVIAQAKPAWVLCENVYGHIRLGLDSVLHDLEALGYSTQSFVVPTLATGKPHKRDRVFIVAYSSSNGCDEGKISGSNGSTDEHIEKRPIKDSNNERRSCLWAEMGGESGQMWGRGTEPPALRVDDGLPNRMDRNRSVGNAVSPEIVFQLLQCVKAH